MLTRVWLAACLIAVAGTVQAQGACLAERTAALQADSVYRLASDLTPRAVRDGSNVHLIARDAAKAALDRCMRACPSIVPGVTYTGSKLTKPEQARNKGDRVAWAVYHHLGQAGLAPRGYVVGELRRCDMAKLAGDVVENLLDGNSTEAGGGDKGRYFGGWGARLARFMLGWLVQ